MNGSNQLSGYIARLQQMPGADGPLVRWGIVCITAIFLWFILLAPWEQMLEHEREMLASQSMEAARLYALQSRVDVWKHADQQFRQALAQASQSLLQNASETIAQSELQKLVQAMIKKHHLKVETQQFIQVAVEPGLGKKVGIELRLTGSMIDGYRFLDTLARNRHLLIIEKLHLGHRNSGDIGIVVRVAGFIAVSEKAL